MYQAFNNIFLFFDGLVAQVDNATNASLWSRLQQVSTTNFLVLSGLLFVIGIAGVLIRRNILIVMMSIELILNSANLNFIAFSRYWQLQGNSNALTGELFTVFVIVLAAAEAAIGLGIIIAFYRNRETVAIDEIDLLKW